MVVTEKTYSELLLSEMWKAKRKEILERDGRKCRSCSSAKNLQVHHKQYHICHVTGQKKEPWNYANRYLITLCNDCHQTGHQLYKIPHFKN